MLKPNAPICLRCGRSVGKQESNNAAPNVYEENIKQTADSYEHNRRVQATNDAVGLFVPFITGHIQSRPTHQQPPNVRTGSEHSSPPLPLLLSIPEVLVEEEKTTDATISDPLPQVENNDKLQALNMFDVLGEDALIAKERDFHGSTKKEQQKRLVVAYAWAYDKIYGKPVPNKEHFHEVAKKARAFDDNFRSRYLAEAIGEFFNDLGTGFKLTSDGEKKAKLIVTEMGDTKNKGYAYWEPSTKSVKTPGRVKKEDAAKVKEWIVEEVDKGDIEIRHLTDGRNCALFSLWAITVCLNEGHRSETEGSIFVHKGKVCDYLSQT